MAVAGGDIPAARAAAHTADDVARSSCIPQSAEGGCLLQHSGHGKITTLNVSSLYVVTEVRVKATTFSEILN